VQPPIRSATCSAKHIDESVALFRVAERFQGKCCHLGGDHFRKRSRVTRSIAIQIGQDVLDHGFQKLRFFATDNESGHLQKLFLGVSVIKEIKCKGREVPVPWVAIEDVRCGVLGFL